MISLTPCEESAILDLVITAIVYKFSELSRDEVLAMLGLELQEPRAFRETRAKGEAEGKAKGEAEGKAKGEAEGKAKGEAEGKAEGKFAATKEGIEAILLVRFGEIDEELAAIVPKLMELESREYTRLLLNLSRSELLALP
jgi:predicted transposase YdaD